MNDSLKEQLAAIRHLVRASDVCAAPKKTGKPNPKPKKG